MNKFKSVLNSCKNFAVKRSPEICIGLGIVGMVGAIIFTGKATIKAKEAVDERKKELEVDELPAKEVVKTTWKYYIPTAISMTSSIALIIMADRVHNKRNAALAVAYSGLETTLASYKDKIKEVVGDKKANEIDGAVAQERIDKAPPVEEREVLKVYPKYTGQYRYYDPFGMMFYTDRAKMDAFQDALNLKIQEECYISVNEYYDTLGAVVHSDLFNVLGWNQSNKKIDRVIFEYSPITDQDGETCTVMSFAKPPIYEYRELY